MHPRSERGLLLKGLLKPLPKKGEVPDCVDPSLKGDVYACESPPTDNPNILCFQPEEDPGCDPEQISNGAIDGKGWVCIDRTATAWQEGEDSY